MNVGSAIKQTLMQHYWQGRIRMKKLDQETSVRLIIYWEIDNNQFFNKKIKVQLNLGFFFFFFFWISQTTYLLCRGFGPVRTLLFSGPKYASPFSSFASPNLEPFLCILTAFMEEKEPFLSLDNLVFPSAKQGFSNISRRRIVHKPATSFPIKPMNSSLVRSSIRYGIGSNSTKNSFFCHLVVVYLEGWSRTRLML